MNKSLFYLFLVTSTFPGFILFQFFKDAYAEYKRTGVFSLETLIGSPTLFFVSLAGFVGMLYLAFHFLTGI